MKERQIYFTVQLFPVILLMFQLEAFLSQRLQEMSCESDVMTTSQFQSAPSSLHVEVETVQNMLTAVQDILSHLTTVRMQHLFLIRSSPRYKSSVIFYLQLCYYLASYQVFQM